MSSSLYNFKRAATVPSAKDLVDIVLSQTQRKTPTVVHPSYDVSRIRRFYMRKCKFAQQAFRDKLETMVADFPKVDDVHPFYSDLMNVLYDRDHYKLALGQVSSVVHQLDNIAKDYVRLLKFGDSLYRCKQLKRACLGRMCTMVLRLSRALTYLEQVRQHLARLPSIDPNTRTILITGFPNVGKSSFMNRVTRADVDVQPYAFTTKSLFVGHMDYKYLRWQVIDTPGILDHPLEDHNTIEMQSITALAHLRACVLYFMDISEQCGYNVKQQVSLFQNIKPLFANKPVLLVLNKCDVLKLEDASEETKELIQSIASGIPMIECSTLVEEGVMEVKKLACDKLLAERVEAKLRSKQMNSVLNQLHLATPQSRDGKVREPVVPPTRMDISGRKLARDIEAENGGPGVFNVDLKKSYLLSDDDWKYDVIPEIYQGKNIADFVDPDIERKLLDLEREEEQLEKSGFYASDSDMEDSETEETRKLVKAIREKKTLMRNEHQRKKALRKNRPAIPRTAMAQNATLQRGLTTATDYNDSNADVDQRRGRKRSRSRSVSAMPISEEVVSAAGPSAKRIARSQSRARSESGLRDPKQKMQAVRVAKASQRSFNQVGRIGEADRVITDAKPRHLFSGKRKSGKTSRR